MKRKELENQYKSLALMYAEFIRGLDMDFWFSIDEYLESIDAYDKFIDKEEVLDNVIYYYHKSLLK